MTNSILPVAAERRKQKKQSRKFRVRVERGKRRECFACKMSRLPPLKPQVLTAYYGNLWNLLPPAPQHTFCKLCCGRTCRHRCGQRPIRSSTIGYCCLPRQVQVLKLLPMWVQVFFRNAGMSMGNLIRCWPHLVGNGLVVDVAGMQMGTIVSYPDSTHCHPCINDRRSTAGYCTFLWGNLVTWSEHDS